MRSHKVLLASLLMMSFSSFAGNDVTLHGESSDPKFKECSITFSEHETKGQTYQLKFSKVHNTKSYGDIDLELVTKSSSSKKTDRYSQSFKVELKKDQVKNTEKFDGGWNYNGLYERTLKLQYSGEQVESFKLDLKFSTTEPITMIQQQCSGTLCEVGVAWTTTKAVLGLPETTKGKNSVSCLNLR